MGSLLENIKQIIKLVEAEEDDVVFVPRDIEGRHAERVADMMKKLNSTEVWKGDLMLHGIPVKDLGKIKKIEGNLIASNTLLTSLPAGLKVEGNLYLTGSRISSLPVGLEVKGKLVLRDCPITSLPANLKVGGVLDLTNSQFSMDIAMIPPGVKVGSLAFEGTPAYIQSMQTAKIWPGNLNLSGSKVENLGKIIQVDGDLNLSKTLVTSLPAGLKVEGVLNISDTKIASLPVGLEVGGEIRINRTPIYYEFFPITTIRIGRFKRAEAAITENYASAKIHPTTRNNLTMLAKKFNIDWDKIYKFSPQGVIKDGKVEGKYYNLVATGKDKKGNTWILDRRRSSQATYVWFNGTYPVGIERLKDMFRTNQIPTKWSIGTLGEHIKYTQSLIRSNN